MEKTARNIVGYVWTMTIAIMWMELVLSDVYLVTWAINVKLVSCIYFRYIYLFLSLKEHHITTRIWNHISWCIYFSRELGRNLCIDFMLKCTYNCSCTQILQVFDLHAEGGILDSRSLLVWIKFHVKLIKCNLIEMFK